MSASSRLKKNPFTFGSTVTGYQFLNRVSERAELIQDIRNHTNVILYSPRRYGKTSLILEVFRLLRKQEPEFVGLFVDFYRVHTREKFLQLLVREYGRNTGWRIEKLLSFFQSVIHSIQPLVTVDDQGRPQLELSFPRLIEPRTFDEVIALPQRLADEGKLVSVVFDEFQEIGKVNGDQFQQDLRSVIQHHNAVSYVFSGSKQHLFNRLFQNPNSPFYNFGKVKYIDKIPAADFSSYLVKKIKPVCPWFKTRHAEDIYTLADGIPYYVQMLAYEFFNLALLNPECAPEKLVEAAVGKLVTEKTEEFLMIYSYLNSSQKKTLEIVALEAGENLFRQDILAKYMIAASTLKKAVTSLVEAGLLAQEKSRYCFQDPFFRSWLVGWI
jgi:hypothetical protein